MFLIMSEVEIARAKVIEHVLAERERQDAIWGDQRDNTDETWALIALEELGEVAKDRGRGQREGFTGPDGLYAALPPRLQPDLRVGALGFSRRCLFGSRAYVD